MELKEGMYVRTKYGIAKIIDIICGQDVKFDNDKIFGDDEDMKRHHEYDGVSKNDYFFEHDIIGEPSYNITDLIRKNDIILGKDGKLYQCWKVYKDYVFTYSKNEQGLTITLVDYQIDKVLIKEQFERESYKI